MNGACYMCAAESTSREQAPPLCVFPEMKDMGDGIDYRNNLITVPACDAHNLRKTKDDEYLHLILVHGYFNNPLAEKQFTTKLTRAFSRRPALLAALHKDNTPVVVDGMDTAAVTIDRKRFTRSLEAVVRALYFHSFGERLELPLRIHTPLLLDLESENAERANQLVTAFCITAKMIVESLPAQGANPAIFWFKMKKTGTGTVVSQLSFYGGFDVFAVASDRFRAAV
jgi:hypothetical protein